jgi:hypothetical protein
MQKVPYIVIHIVQRRSEQTFDRVNVYIYMQQGNQNLHIQQWNIYMQHFCENHLKILIDRTDETALNIRIDSAKTMIDNVEIWMESTRRENDWCHMV